MEMRDVVVILLIMAGVLALKGFYDLFVGLPIWFLYLAIVFFFAFLFIGLFALVGSRGRDVNLRVGIAALSVEPKNSLKNAAALWLDWPWWALMLAAWMLFEPWSVGGIKVLSNSLGLDLEREIPFFGSPFVLLSLTLTYIGLVLFTALLTLLKAVSSKEKPIGECPRCKRKHGIADNYCSNCGAILPRKKL